MAQLRKNNAKKDEVEVVEVAEVEVKEVEVDEDISVIDNAVAKSKEVEVKTTKAKAEPNVRVNPKQDIRTFIGDQWYNLKAGKQVSVPKTVKDKLQRAGLLDPL